MSNDDFSLDCGQELDDSESVIDQALIDQDQQVSDDAILTQVSTDLVSSCEEDKTLSQESATTDQFCSQAVSDICSQVTLYKHDQLDLDIAVFKNQLTSVINSQASPPEMNDQLNSYSDSSSIDFDSILSNTASATDNQDDHSTNDHFNGFNVEASVRGRGGRGGVRLM